MVFSCRYTDVEAIDWEGLRLKLDSFRSPPFTWSPFSYPCTLGTLVAASVCFLVSSATFTEAIRLICHDFEREWIRMYLTRCFAHAYPFLVLLDAFPSESWLVWLSGGRSCYFCHIPCFLLASGQQTQKNNGTFPVALLPWHRGLLECKDRGILENVFTWEDFRFQESLVPSNR